MSADAVIVVRHKGAQMSRIPLDRPEAGIGRGLDNLIVLPGSAVSRRHARIVLREGVHYIEDIGSAAGTQIQGFPVAAPTPLADGDVVSICDYEMVYERLPPQEPRQGAAAESSFSLEALLAVVDQPVDAVALRPPSPAEAGVATEMVPGAELETLRNASGGFEVPLPGPPAPSGPWEAPPGEKSGGTDDGVVIDLTGSASAQRLEALFEINQTIERARDFGEVLTALMDKAIAVMGAERGLIMLEEPSTGELRLRVARHRAGRDLDGVEAEKVSRSLIQRAIETGKPMFILSGGSGAWDSKSIVEHSIHSAVCVPLMMGQHAAGVIYVDHRAKALAFTHEDIAFLASFAVQAKTAIDSSRSSTQLVEGLFGASQDLLVVCKPDGEISEINRAGCAILGLGNKHLVGERFADIVASEVSEEAEKLCRETIETGVVAGRELAMVGKGRRMIPMSVSSFALKDRSGNPTGLCIIGRDMSYVASLIGQLTEAKEQVERQSRFIRATFGRYLSDEIVESLLETPEGLQLGGERRKVTVMMSDIRGFSAIAERLQPEQVVDMLNIYLGAMAEIILKHQGTIDEFIGDAIFAIFGAPVQRPDDARRALACALEMQIESAKVNEDLARAGLPRIEIGIGINTGEVVVGNIGSQRRSKYAVVGTQVNLTSRIETYTVGGQVLISDSARREAGTDLVLGRRIEISAKGFAEPIPVFDLRGIGGEYKLQLQEQKVEYVAVARPVTVRFVVLEGKHVGADWIEGQIHELAEQGARIKTAHQLSPLENLKMMVLGVDGQPVPGALYAKVQFEAGATADIHTLRFTSVPPEIASYFDSVRVTSGG